MLFNGKRSGSGLVVQTFENFAGEIFWRLESVGLGGELSFGMAHGGAGHGGAVATHEISTTDVASSVLGNLRVVE
jgi:hypothetical protein